MADRRDKVITMGSFESRHAKIKQLLRCPICKKLLRDVTTIDECLHMFCKKRITRKITEERLRYCPVCNVRDELEQLLDDDDDMADLYLSRKLAGPSSPGSVAASWVLASSTIGSRISRASRASIATVRGDENDVEELEMLLELREYIDNTEDYINIQLDNHRNQLIQLELFLSSGTVCLAIYSLIAAIFGMNIPYTWMNNHN